MNKELIKQKIKELDTNNKIKNIDVSINQWFIQIELDYTFRILYDISTDIIICDIAPEEDNNNSFVYHEGDNIDNIDYYVNIPIFFKENKDKIKQIIRGNL